MNNSPIFEGVSHIGGAPVALGNNIKEARKRRGWTQRDLAEQIGSDPSYVNRVETGKINPTVAVAERLADALGCTLDYLVKGPESEADIRDKRLSEKIRLIDDLDEDDRSALLHMIDTMLAKKQIREVLDGKLGSGAAQSQTKGRQPPASFTLLTLFHLAPLNLFLPAQMLHKVLKVSPGTDFERETPTANGRAPQHEGEIASTTDDRSLQLSTVPCIANFLKPGTETC